MVGVAACRDRFTEDRRHIERESVLEVGAAAIGDLDRIDLREVGVLRERFGIPLRLDFYDAAELEEIVRRGARVLDVALTQDGAAEIAGRARGTPRIAGRLLRRLRDFAAMEGADTVDSKVADRALSRLEVDERGLDSMDRRYLNCIAENYGGGPVGVETLAAALSEERDTIEEVIEPYLIQQGFLMRTPRGRALASEAYRHLGLKEPKEIAQLELIADVDENEDE